MTVQIITTIAAMQTRADAVRAAGRSIGVVPTMGYLHTGHASLIARARAENDVVVVTIFVNPLQFGANEDLARYPRDLQRDLTIVTDAGADIVFAPDAGEMYPPGFDVAVEVGGLTTLLEGAARRGHFRGVTTVVAKLFNITRPTRAYFGQKDAQQVAVIRKMVRDLAFGVAIVVCPIVREEDGLALSSRNVYLSTDERQAALALSRGLRAAQTAWVEGERRATALKEAVLSVLAGQPMIQPDYVSVADPDDLHELESIGAGERVLVSLAARIGKTRLIDNVLLS